MARSNTAAASNGQHPASNGSPSLGEWPFPAAFQVPPMFDPFKLFQPKEPPRPANTEAPPMKGFPLPQMQTLTDPLAVASTFFMFGFVCGMVSSMALSSTMFRPFTNR